MVKNLCLFLFIFLCFTEKQYQPVLRSCQGQGKAILLILIMGEKILRIK